MSICPPFHTHALALGCYTGHDCRCHDCRCHDCREHHAEYIRASRRLRGLPVTTSALGTKRRLQALATLGYSTVRIADDTGINVGQLHRYRLGHHPRILEGTARTIAHYYRDTCYIPAPVNHLTRSMIDRARAAGWQPPTAWHNPDTDPEPVEAAA